MTWEELGAGWEVASTLETRASPAHLCDLQFIPAEVPGTVAGALRAAKRWQPGASQRFDNAEHWFRCRFPAQPGADSMLRFGGIATLAEVWLNGQSILTSDSMFDEHVVDVTALLGESNDLVIVCRSLSAALAARRRCQPSARWRTRVVAEQQLRWFRTTLLGCAPGFAPEPEPVGPWRPVSILRGSYLANWSCSASLSGANGVVDATFDVKGKAPVGGSLHVGGKSRELEFAGTHAAARCVIANAQPWWPHTHGVPMLYPVRVELEFEDGTNSSWHPAPIGFRQMANTAGDSLALQVNGAKVFCRGAVWTPIDSVTLRATPAELRQRLALLRDAGINLIRIAGTAYYEDDTFHRMCDELGILVWQDMMFANMDYPFGDAAFASKVAQEAGKQLQRLALHASTAVICGNSEIEQQAGMLGLEPNSGRASFFGEVLPALTARYLPDSPYFPSAPCGGHLPFRTNQGLANYFGVGAYLRPLEDTRRAEVRFASECLAFSNVPEPEMVDQMSAATPGGISPTHPNWKRGVPRDAGVGWDFEDVRDHYLKLLYSVDPIALRYASTDRYFDLSRLVSGELMAEVFGEWRRPASTCGGGIVLWCGDLQPGAGWGIFDSTGNPKAAYWFLKRSLAPVAIWTTDEGLNGIDIHVSNDGPDPLKANLRTALYQHGERRVGQASRSIEVEARGSVTVGMEAILGHFADATYAYRFGQPGHDLAVASLYLDDEKSPSAQAFRFPNGRPTTQTNIGLSGRCYAIADGSLRLTLQSERFAWGVRVAARGYRPNDQYFGLEPGVARHLRLAPQGTAPTPASIVVTAVNSETRLTIPVEPAP